MESVSITNIMVVIVLGVLLYAFFYVSYKAVIDLLVDIDLQQSIKTHLLITPVLSNALDKDDLLKISDKLSLYASAIETRRKLISIPLMIFFDSRQREEIFNISFSNEQLHHMVKFYDNTPDASDGIKKKLAGICVMGDSIQKSGTATAKRRMRGIGVCIFLATFIGTVIVL